MDNSLDEKYTNHIYVEGKIIIGNTLSGTMMLTESPVPTLFDMTGVKSPQNVVDFFDACITGKQVVHETLCVLLGGCPKVTNLICRYVISFSEIKKEDVLPKFSRNTQLYCLKGISRIVGLGVMVSMV